MTKTTNLGLVKPTHGINEVEGNTLGVPNEAVNLDAIDTAIGTINTTLSGLGASVGPGSVPTYTASGAITQKLGTITLSGTGAQVMTIADPTSGTDDGKHLSIIATSAHAHTVATVSGISGGANHKSTFGGALGDMLKLVALGGVWYLEPSINQTLSAS